MARAARPAKAAPRERRRRAVNVETLRGAAERFLARFDSLVAEVQALREALAASQQENERLRAELIEGVELFRRAEMALGGSTLQRKGRRVSAAGSADRAPRRSPGSGPEERHPRSRLRTTPTSVTAEVVRRVIEARGTATASEIAEEIATGGTPVSGRAIRHIAKSAGAVARPGADGRMVYSLS